MGGKKVVSEKNNREKIKEMRRILNEEECDDIE